MRLFCLLSIVRLATVGWSSTIPRSESVECSTFAKNLDLAEYNTSLVNSTYFATGQYVEANISNNAPFCQIYANIKYGNPGDRMLFVIWLPQSSDYTGRFLAVGNGGFAGVVETASMLADFNLGLGFAVAGGDGGHTAAANDDGNGAPDTYLPFLHDPYQIQGWIHNGISLFTPVAKAITEARYKYIKHSYYDGCSTGGAQGFALAQFHPALFEGIVASSPGNWYSHLALSFLWNFLHANSNTTYISQTQLSAMTDAVVAACDGQNGVNDGVVDNPLTCRFDIDSFACNASKPSLNSTVCLTAAQLGTAKAIYAGPVDSVTGRKLYPGFSLGSESSWLYQETVLADAFSIPLLQNVVYDNLTYNATTFNFGSDVVAVNTKLSPLIDEINPDLQDYHSRGGKLLSVQGWADPLNAATWPIEHLHQIQAAFGGDVSSWFQLYMSPGAGHCGVNPEYPNVPGTYSSTAALVSWVEKNVPPESIRASQPPSGLNITRKLCPYPEIALYAAGNVNEWTSFSCSR